MLMTPADVNDTYLATIDTDQLIIEYDKGLLPGGMNERAPVDAYRRWRRLVLASPSFGFLATDENAGRRFDII